MRMHNPPHPGEFIAEIYIKPFELSIRKVASSLNVAPSTFGRLINGESRITPEMAIRLSKTLGRSPESWLSMQNNYDLWRVRNAARLRSVRKLDLISA